MAFLNNKKFAEIREAAKNGNEKAAMIMQAMLKNSPQQDVDNLVNDYYNINNDITPLEEPVQETVDVEEEIVNDPVNPMLDEVEPIETEMPAVVDLSSSLDAEMEGLLDENELDTISFGDFLANKQRDALRGRKNNDYFKVFDLDGRNTYMQDKIAKYGQKFDNNRRDIEREYLDLDKAIGNHMNNVNYMLDDDLDLNMDTTSQAYDELVGNDKAMKSFGRHWDEQDNEEINLILQELVMKYGKKNIMAVLNTLKNDNENYKNFKNNQIDTEVNRYSKSVENLLK